MLHTFLSLESFQNFIPLCNKIIWKQFFFLVLILRFVRQLLSHSHFRASYSTLKVSTLCCGNQQYSSCEHFTFFALSYSFKAFLSLRPFPNTRPVSTQQNSKNDPVLVLCILVSSGLCSSNSSCFHLCGALPFKLWVYWVFLFVCLFFSSLQFILFTSFLQLWASFPFVSENSFVAFADIAQCKVGEYTCLMLMLRMGRSQGLTGMIYLPS